MILSRRSAALALSSLGIISLAPSLARATTAIALSLEQLVQMTDRVVVGRVVQFESDWAYLGGSRRIVTYSRVVQEDDLLQDSRVEDEIIVLTLGGKVGSLRQKVAGEAALRRDERCVLFVSQEYDLFRRVVAMAQGHYPLSETDRLAVLRPSHQLPHLVGARPGAGPERKRAAIDVLSGRTLEGARALVRGAR